MRKFFIGQYVNISHSLIQICRSLRHTTRTAYEQRFIFLELICDITKFVRARFCTINLEIYTKKFVILVLKIYNIQIRDKEISNNRLK